MFRTRRSVAKRPVTTRSGLNYVMHSMPKTGWKEPRLDCKFASQPHSTLLFFSNPSSGSSLEPAKEKTSHAD
jgi:hypothetical protein